MPQALDGRVLEEIVGEVDREWGWVRHEMTDQFVAVKTGDHANQFFNLLVFQHLILRREKDAVRRKCRSANL
jgi:hypothetical protein